MVNKKDKKQSLEPETSKTYTTSFSEDKDKEKEKVKSARVRITDVGRDCLFFRINGWEKRIKLDLNKENLEEYRKNISSYRGRFITVKYKGDINDPFNVKVLPLKKL